MTLSTDQQKRAGTKCSSANLRRTSYALRTPTFPPATSPGHSLFLIISMDMDEPSQGSRSHTHRTPAKSMHVTYVCKYVYVYVQKNHRPQLSSSNTETSTCRVWEGAPVAYRRKHVVCYASLHFRLPGSARAPAGVGFRQCECVCVRERVIRWEAAESVRCR